jgi:hypothetical protein
MLFPARSLLFTWLAGTAIASAQCPVDTVIVKGRVENSTRDSKVRVQLMFANDQPGPSAETAPQDGTFRLPIEFLTQSTRPLLTNLKPKCDRRPISVVIRWLAGDQEIASLTLDFKRDFKMTDFSAYMPQSDIVLKASR